MPDVAASLTTVSGVGQNFYQRLNQYALVTESFVRTSALARVEEKRLSAGRALDAVSILVSRGMSNIDRGAMRAFLAVGRRPEDRQTRIVSQGFGPYGSARIVDLPPSRISSFAAKYAERSTG